MSWLTPAQITGLSDTYDMGAQWDTRTADERLKLSNVVSARWASFPWISGSEPEATQTGTRWMSMDESLKSAFAMHLRYLADSAGSPDVKIEEDDDRQILSDVPRYTRNILLGRYVNTDDRFPWSAEPQRRGRRRIIYVGADD